MKIICSPPPNLERIAKVFPQAKGPNVIFAYGDTIFNPSKLNLTKQLLAHEAIHGERQLAYQGGVEAWWETYLTDMRFVFDEELPAHIAEYKAYKPGKHGYSRAGFLQMVAKKLASPLYNKVVTVDEAIRLIQEGADK